MSEDTILQEIVIERRKQDAKWGEQDHRPVWWLAIAVEELGEAAEATLECSALSIGRK